MRKKGIKIDEIIDLHNQGFSPIQIAEKLGCGISNISKRLIKNGIKPLRKSNESWARKNRYKINEAYFEKIDSEDKAYILGLLYADGSVSREGFYLKMKDEDILLKIKNKLEAEQPVKWITYEGYYSYLFSISSQKMSRDLTLKGCFVNKTYTLKFPTKKQVPIKLIRHFLRGFFDGDGHLGITDNLSTCRFDFTSAATDFLNGAREIISKISISNGSLHKESGISNAWHLKYSGRQVKQILEWLYKDATIFMKRKYDKFMIYKNMIE